MQQHFFKINRGATGTDHRAGRGRQMHVHFCPSRPQPSLLQQQRRLSRSSVQVQLFVCLAVSLAS